MRKKKGVGYYKAFTLQDGTVLLAMPTHKPHPHSLGRKKQIPEDGLWWEMVETPKDLQAYVQGARHLVYSTIANRLNLRRILADRIETRLDALATQIEVLNERLERIEHVLLEGHAFRK